MISISHKIELCPNNKQKTYIRKACGCSRLAWNWGVAECNQLRKQEQKVDIYEIKKQFNAIKKTKFPFVCEVTKYAVQEPFLDLKDALIAYYNKTAEYPKHKKKKLGEGSFYIGGDQIHLSYENKNSKTFESIPHNLMHKHQYLYIPKLGYVKMSECLRFNGRINGVRVVQNAGKFFAAFSLSITEEEYKRTHSRANNTGEGVLAIDLGIREPIVVSSGLGVKNQHFLKKAQERIVRYQRKLSKRVHAKTKQERLEGVVCSGNYHKLALRTGKLMHRQANRRHDFINKVTTVLTTSCMEIAMETLSTKNMMKNHRLAGSIADVSFFEIRRQIEYKAAYSGVNVIKADKWYPSSKTCSCCGNVVQKLSLGQRTYSCSKCGLTIDRDLNAAINLRNLIYKDKIGSGRPEFTPVELLIAGFERNHIAVRNIEAGKQHKL